MLVLTRKCNQSIRIGEDIWVEVVRINASDVRLGIDAHPDINIVRTEIDTPRLREQFQSKQRGRTCPPPAPPIPTPHQPRQKMRLAQSVVDSAQKATGSDETQSAPPK